VCYVHSHKLRNQSIRASVLVDLITNLTHVKVRQYSVDKPRLANGYMKDMYSVYMHTYVAH